MTTVPRQRAANQLSLLPVFEFEAANPAEFADISGDQHKGPGNGLTCNQDIKWPDGRAFAAQSCPDFGRCHGITGLEFQDFKAQGVNPGRIGLFAGAFPRSEIQFVHDNRRHTVLRRTVLRHPRNDSVIILNDSNDGIDPLLYRADNSLQMIQTRTNLVRHRAFSGINHIRVQRAESMKLGKPVPTGFERLQNDRRPFGPDSDLTGFKPESLGQPHRLRPPRHKDLRNPRFRHFQLPKDIYQKDINLIIADRQILN